MLFPGPASSLGASVGPHHSHPDGHLLTIYKSLSQSLGLVSTPGRSSEEREGYWTPSCLLGPGQPSKPLPGGRNLKTTPCSTPPHKQRKAVSCKESCVTLGNEEENLRSSIALPPPSRTPSHDRKSPTQRNGRNVGNHLFRAMWECLK